MLKYDFARYLSSKKSVDDRSLNKNVWNRMAVELSSCPNQAINVLELGCGIGTMIERTADWGLFQHANYTAIDEIAQNIDEAFTQT